MTWRALLGLEKPADPAPATRTLTVDRSRMFDLALISRLAELIALPMA